MRMKAAVIHELNLPAPYAQSQPFSIEEVDLEGPGEGEVLVEVRGAGLCHSDLHYVAGIFPKRSLPMVGGHEGAGIVREVGRGVKELKVGDHVVMTGASGCGHCRSCIDIRPALCDSVGASRTQGTLANGSVRLSSNGKPIYHYTGISSFAQFAVLLPSSLIKIDPSVPLDVASMFGCAVVTGAGAVFNAAKVRPGDNVAVFGLGGVGLNTVMAAKISGASAIIGIDLSESKLQVARDVGCTHTFLASDPELVQKIAELTRGGVDFAFEVSGSQPAMVSATAITRKGGDVICVGVGRLDAVSQYSHAGLVLQEKSFRGSFMGSGVAQRDVLRYVDFFMAGKMPIDKLKSGTMTFEELNINLDRLHSGEVTRQVLLPHG